MQLPEDERLAYDAMLALGDTLDVDSKEAVDDSLKANDDSYDEKKPKKRNAPRKKPREQLSKRKQMAQDAPTALGDLLDVESQKALEATIKQRDESNDELQK